MAQKTVRGGLKLGTMLFNKYGLNVKRFYGGEHRGVCFQVTLVHGELLSINRYGGYVQLTEKQFKELVKCLLDHFFDRAT